ncbi:unnamed protein product [Staurois parvus]|uniref:Uncharacterized protein n=1 Tax=Staurois parvus TaxID=386267 RepID=A0ABN9BFV8_9NEOB|nr:unnamed protein product [Staurois parvus]
MVSWYRSLCSSAISDSSIPPSSSSFLFYLFFNLNFRISQVSILNIYNKNDINGNNADNVQILMILSVIVPHLPDDGEAWCDLPVWNPGNTEDGDISLVGSHDWIHLDPCVLLNTPTPPWRNRQ